MVHLTGKLRIGQVQVDFGTGSRSVSPIAADLIQVQTMVHQMGQHQMSQLVGSQLRQAERIPDLIEDLRNGPLDSWAVQRSGLIRRERAGQHPQPHTPQAGERGPPGGSLAGSSRWYWRARFGLAFCSWSVREES